MFYLTSILVADPIQRLGILIAVKAEGQDPSEVEILSIFEDKIAKWQIPDRVVFTDALPRNATGKVLKRDLRESFGEVLING